MEKKKNTPKLRFPEFTGEWEEKKLGEIANISSGGTPNRSNSRYWNGNIAWITTSLINFNVIYKAEEYITDEGLQNSSAKLFPSGTLLMAMYGQGVTRGKVSILGIEASCNQACCAIVPKKNLYDKLFIFQNLFYRYDEIRNLSNQGGQQNLSGEIIKNIPIKLAAYSEQTKIATFLTAVDEKLTQLIKKKTLLEQYKKGVMQKLFSQELRFKDDNNQDFPDWQEKTLGEMGETYNGLTGKNKDSFGTGKPYIQYKQIFDDSKIDVTRFELVEISYDEKQNKVKFGDIFFTVSSETPDEVGMSSVLLNEVEELYLNSFCFGYRPFSLQILSPFYARYLFRSEQFRKTVIVLAQGSTRYNLSKLGMMNLIIGLPSLPEQQKIATFLSSIDEKIIHCGKQIEKMEAWKKGLLQQMFC